MTLLIAGPGGSDGDGLLAGAGVIAAVAAVPLMQVQLWARLGDQQQALAEVLRRRGIAIEGIGWEGPAVRVLTGGQPEPGPLLPEVEPTSAEGLGGALILGLEPAELQRAEQAVAALAPPILVMVAETALPTGAPPTILIGRIGALLRLTRSEDALQAARAVQALGIKSVVVTSGMLGGLVVHGELATTYPGLPQGEKSPTGAALAAFAGALSGWCAGAGADFAGLKRGCGVASAVAGILVQGGIKRLMAADRAQCLERFNRLRRATKA